ncbi:jg25918, partial [Pararge aegeria aegeria]
ITSRLEYLRDLGIDAAWLSPIFKSPMHDFGYDVSDYYSVHPEYGSVEDFEHLLKKAHELNIKIILDFVPNHTSNESDWFFKSSHRDEYYSDWYIWENGHLDTKGLRRPPNNWTESDASRATFKTLTGPPPNLLDARSRRKPVCHTL